MLSATTLDVWSIPESRTPQDMHNVALDDHVEKASDLEVLRYRQDRDRMDQLGLQQQKELMEMFPDEKRTIPGLACRAHLYPDIPEEIGLSPTGNEFAPCVEEPEDNQTIANSVRGAMYDMKHWDQLPGDSGEEKCAFVATRDGRGPYLAAGMFVVLMLVVLLILCICLCAKSAKSRRVHNHYRHMMRY